MRLKTIVLAALLWLSLTAAQERVKIAVWGDSRENADGACEEIVRILLHDITDWDFIIHTGDFTHSGEEVDWQRSLAYKDMKKLFVPGKFFMCTSNHDDNQSTWDKYTKDVLPVNDLNRSTHYYSVQKNNVHVVFCDAVFTSSGIMNKWLEKDLEKVKPKDWLIGVWHNPCYDEITYKEGYLDTCMPWLQTLYGKGGDFLLHGHAHVYVRTHPLLPDGKVNHKKGMVHIVNGVGGANWKSSQAKTEKTAFTPQERSFPVITFLTFTGNQALLQTIDARPGKKLAVVDECKWQR